MQSVPVRPVLAAMGRNVHWSHSHCRPFSQMCWEAATKVVADQGLLPGNFLEYDEFTIFQILPEWIYLFKNLACSLFFKIMRDQRLARIFVLFEKCHTFSHIRIDMRLNSCQISVTSNPSLLPLMGMLTVLDGSNLCLRAYSDYRKMRSLWLWQIEWQGNRKFAYRSLWNRLHLVVIFGNYDVSYWLWMVRVRGEWAGMSGSANVDTAGEAQSLLILIPSPLPILWL